MKIIDLLIKKKYFAGVEISDTMIRVSFFRPQKKELKTKIELQLNELVLIEEPLPENTVSDGVIMNKGIIEKILKDLWKREDLNESYVVVSVPEDKIYSHIFTFPKAVIGPRLEEAINLAIDFQLPFKRENSYIDWEEANDSDDTNKVLISAIPKKVADDYISVLDNAGISIFALESHIHSIARSIKLEQGETTLLTKKNKDSATIFIIKNNILQFSRTLPAIFTKDDELLKNEINKIKNSLEAEFKGSIREFKFEEAVIKDEYLKYLESTANKEQQSKWLISVGAVIRGEISQGEDNQISLLPIGTAETYQYQKKKIFIRLIRNMSIIVSIFFLFVFIAAYFFIFSISQIVNNASSNASMLSISPGILDKEKQINKVNNLTQISETILSETPNWSILIDEIKTRAIDGIIISSFNATSISDTISITGIARDRDILNQFKKSLQESIYLSEVMIPITNLEQKADIPFSTSFRLKDPSMLYNR